MRVAKGNGPINALPLLMAFCLCVLSLAQVSRPLRSIGWSSSRALAVTQAQLTRHALQEVSPRHSGPPAPYAIGMLAVVPVNHRCELPRLTQRTVPVWPIETWPTHRRLVPSTDNPEPA